MGHWYNNKCYGSHTAITGCSDNAHYYAPLPASYWHDRLQQLFWTFSHTKQNQQNCFRSPLEEVLNLGFSCPFQFYVKLKIWWHLLNIFEDEPVTPDVFPFSVSLLAPWLGPNLCCWNKAVLGCFHDYSLSWRKDLKEGCRDRRQDSRK